MLRDKVAVITGGTRGIGKAIATAFVQNGAAVAILATTDNEQARQTLQTLQAFGRKVLLYCCDVSDARQVEETVGAILTEFGRVDILVNNAGITRDNLLPAMSVEDIDRVIDVNCKGAMYMTRALIRQFVRQKSGNVIQISSVVGMMGNTGQANYAAAKAGLIGFTKSVAKEYGKRNIRCNAIAPGYICTDMTENLSEEQVRQIQEGILLKRLGNPEDVANLALFLASDQSSYITGEVIKVDGGMYA